MRRIVKKVIKSDLIFSLSTRKTKLLFWIAFRLENCTTLNRNLCINDPHHFNVFLNTFFILLSLTSSLMRIKYEEKKRRN